MAMTRRTLALLAGAFGATSLAAAAFLTGGADAAVATGKPAPAFSVLDTAGKTRTLAEFADKTVVLEWTNDQCPFVVKHYATGNMQALQKAAAADGVVWLSVISSAPGKQGHVAPEKANALTTQRSAAPSAVLLDPTGAMGKAYGAKTTPHMYVIHKGALVYQGGIDDNSSGDHATVKTAKNFVAAALADVKAGRPVATPASRPYGCSVKY